MTPNCSSERVGCQVVLRNGLVFPCCDIEYRHEVGGGKVGCMVTFGHLGDKNRVLVDIDWRSWVKGVGFWARVGQPQLG